MKKILGFISFLIIVFFVLTPLVYAEQNTAGNEEGLQNQLMNKAEQKTVREENKVETKTMLQETKTERKATMEALQEQKKEMREGFVGNRLTVIAQFTIRKLEAAISRLTNIIARFTSRLEKIGLNRDVAAATTQLNLAKTNLQEAETVLETVKATFDSFAESEDLKVLFTTFRDQVKEVKTYLMETHKALKMGIAGLKESAFKVTTMPEPTTVLEATIMPTVAEGVNTP